MNDDELKKRVIELFDVDTVKGLIWHNENRGRVKAGDMAGSRHRQGYIVIAIYGNVYYRHRLIFLVDKGYLPEYIDHINSVPGDDRISNLREATRKQNGMNRRPYKNSSSIYKGVSWNKSGMKWRAHIRINGKLKALGSFSNESEAARAYDISAIENFGKFVKTNKMLGLL